MLKASILAYLQHLTNVKLYALTGPKRHKVHGDVLLCTGSLYTDCTAFTLAVVKRDPRGSCLDERACGKASTSRRSRVSSERPFVVEVFLYKIFVWTCRDAWTIKVFFLCFIGSYNCYNCRALWAVTVKGIDTEL